MKVLVFAHTPPPHHGQSHMVELMIGGLTQEGSGIEVHHVNSQLSRTSLDIGKISFTKLGLLLGYCLQAVWHKIRYGITVIYYVPAPPKRSALYRDFLVMSICRPLYQHLVLHWHAVGLGTWLDNDAWALERWVGRTLLGRAELSIILSEAHREDVSHLMPKAIEVVPNGIPDPLRGGPLPERQREHDEVGVLFLAYCTREKGLFDAIEAIRIANDSDDRRFVLRVCGQFMSPEEEQEFRSLEDSLRAIGVLEYLGFVTGEAKERAFLSADTFLFPTYHHTEAQPINLIEAMAYGVPIITTRWRGLPEMLPSGYRGLVDVHSPAQIAQLLIAGTVAKEGDRLRHHFLDNFTLDTHIARIAAALDPMA